jgi:serine/threonine-protein kinase RsbW
MNNRANSVAVLAGSGIGASILSTSVQKARLVSSNDARGTFGVVRRVIKKREKTIAVERRGFSDGPSMSLPQGVNKPLVMSLDSALESVDRAEEEVLRFARAAGFGEEDLYKVGLAVRDSMVNAVLHGNHCDPGKKASLRAELQNGRLVVTITDQGAGFDLGDVPDPLAEANMMRHSGRGVLLIRAFMDELKIRRLAPRGTEVRMVKYRSEESDSSLNQ